MLLDGTQCFRGNMAHEQLSDDIMGDKRPNRRPAPGEIVYNTDMHQWAIRCQKPGDFHTATDAPYVGKMHAMVCWFTALPGRPTHWKFITVCGHLNQAFCGVS